MRAHVQVHACVHATQTFKRPGGIHAAACAVAGVMHLDVQFVVCNFTLVGFVCVNMSVCARAACVLRGVFRAVLHARRRKEPYNSARARAGPQRQQGRLAPVTVPAFARFGFTTNAATMGDVVGSACRLPLLERGRGWRALRRCAMASDADVREVERLAALPPLLARPLRGPGERPRGTFVTGVVGCGVPRGSSSARTMGKRGGRKDTNGGGASFLEGLVWSSPWIHPIAGRGCRPLRTHTQMDCTSPPP